MSDEPRKTPSSSAVDEQKAIGTAQAAPETQSEREQKKAAKEFSRIESKDKLVMRVRVYSPFRNYYDGQAFSISAVNATGPFDILPKHHNFISLLSPCDLVIRTVGEGDRKIIISGGVMHVRADQIIVFLDV
jgi:hypothetical protein